MILYFGDYTLKGYGGHFVKVNLSAGEIEVIETPKDFIELIGGKMFAAKYFYENVSVSDPLSPDNVLLIAIGPACGTKVPMASKVGFYFLSPLTNYFGESYMGGNFMAEMKWAGIDAFLIYGRSEKPVYIYAHDTSVEIRDASSIWGTDTHKAEDMIKEDIGYKDACVATIGQAGENLVKFAVVSHNYGSIRRESKAGRMGAGAVMGSKRLKGIAVAASEKDVDVYDSDVVLTAVKSILTKISKDPKIGAATYRKYGTPATLFYGLNKGFFPSHYFTKGGSDFEEELNPDNFREKYYDHNLACYNCPFSCGKYIKVKEGKYAGLEGKHPEYETIYAFGGQNEVGSYDAIAKINEVCDLYGIDTIEAGNVLALLAYATEKGRINGDDLKFGDVDAIIKLLNDITFRRGLGDKLAEGVKRFSELMGIEDLAIHSKGLAPPGYDPRVLRFMAFEYAVNNRGADHLRMTAYAFELSGRLNQPTLEEKISYLVNVEDRLIIFDSLVLCRFARYVYEWDDIIQILYGLTGRKYRVEELREKANYARTLIRKFNLKRGLNPERDDDISERFYNEVIKFSGTEYKITREEVKTMVKFYYKFRGWNEEGYPRN
mgnify:CR=1 FL=1